MGYASCKPAEAIVCLFLSFYSFSAAEKARCVKFCMCVGVLSGQVFSPFGDSELGAVARWAVGTGGGGVA